MKTVFIFLSLVCLAFPPAGAQELKCEDIKPKIKSLKVMTMRPVKRNKVWLEGNPGSVFQTSCAADGLKTEEAEYRQKTLVSKKRFIHKTMEEIKAMCRNIKSEKKVNSSFGEDSRSELEIYCREKLKKDFDAVMVYDAVAAPNASGALNLIRQTFRFFNSKGFPVEEHQFDLYMGLEVKITYKYRGKNDLAEKTDYGPDGDLLEQEVYSFNKAANTRTVSVFNEHGQPTKKTVYEYRKDGTCSKEIRTTYDSGEQMLSKSEIYRDEKGAPRKEVVYEGSFENPVYEYRYAYKSDKNGNWIEEWKTKFLAYGNKRLKDKSAAPRIIKREITYY
ncbi:MAG: hypothetical protein KKH28_08255 [Elusimicrobia bacterium]|nr:hypothetical protein [Elusimicrobiota bacterium]